MWIPLLVYVFAQAFWGPTPNPLIDDFPVGDGTHICEDRDHTMIRCNNERACRPYSR
jgi:hypothetical protein